MSGSSVVNYRAAIVGQPRTGKSTLLWALACALPCVWLFDPVGAHACPPNGVRFRPDLASPRDDRRGGRYYDDVERLARHAAATGGPDGLTLCIDEANLAVRTGQVGPPAVGEILHEGRHMPYGAPTGVGAVLVARRPAELPPHWLATIGHLFVFRLVNPRDLAWARASGLDDEAVRTLPTGHFLHINYDAGLAPHVHTHALSACKDS